VDNVDITVSEPIHKKEGLTSFVTYTVKVKNIADPLQRRFNDFYILRSKLVDRWPGVYIPNIPPKKAVVKK
jgi:sorting nexin-1/2